LPVFGRKHAPLHNFRKAAEGPAKFDRLWRQTVWFRGVDPDKPDSNFAFLRPFSQLGNPHALGVSVLRPSASIGGDREFCPVLEPNCLISGG